MADIVIGRAEVIAIEKVTLENPKPKPPVHPQAYSQGQYGSISNGTFMPDSLGSAMTINTEYAPPKPKTVVISRLKVESAGKVEGFSVIEGIMQLPIQLPFGKVFELTLHDPGTGVLDTNDRMFKDEKDAG